MFKLVRGTPIQDISFNNMKAKAGKYRHKMVCDNIFTIDTETTSDFIDENGNPFMFDYDNPEKAQNAIKHSVCYLWQFGIDEETRYIGRSLYELCDLLYLLNQYCPFHKIVWCHNLAFDFNFFQNVFRITNVFARKPRHPMTAYLPDYHVEMRCSYVLTNLSLENWAISLNLPVRKKTGLLQYDKMRTPLTPSTLTDEEIEYSIADLDVIYYGIDHYKKQYGHVWDIPLTHTGKMRRACMKVMESETGYCEKVTKLMPQSLDEYVEQAHAFLGGSVFCNWLYKNRLIKEDIKQNIRLPAYDIASSYPYVLVACKYPSTPFFKVTDYKKYMHKDRYVYIVRFSVEKMESVFNCHFMSRSKALALKGCESDNGRIIRSQYAEFILTSVDFELFERCYTYENLKIISFRVSYAKPLNDKFRRFIIELYKDKTTLKGVEGKQALYQNKKEYINSTYGDFVTKIFSDEVIYDQKSADNWSVNELTEERFQKTLKSLNKKRYKNYKAFCQGIFVTAWARARIWNAVIELDEHIMYSDTDSLKLYDYDGDYFDKENAVVLTRHQQIADELKIDVDDLSPVDIKGIRHPLGVWEFEGYYEEFKSLGCKQYMYRDQKGIHLTCAGISKLAVQCFDNVDDFKIDRRLSEKELKQCTDGKGHTAEKLTPYYSNDYPVVRYPDGYVCKYKYGVCLMPTTFNLSMTAQDLMYLYGEVAEKLNKSYYRRG